jgi:drug/metabolite transporter (DMT)-like permease
MARIPHAIKVAAALALLYSSWGSSYIANHFAIEDMPPFLMTSARMLIASALMWGISLLQRDPTRPRPVDVWRHFIVACPMIVFGSGFLAKSQETVSSSTAALMLGITPAWLLLGGWAARRLPRPSLWQALGLLIGFIGLSIIARQTRIDGQSSYPLGFWYLLICIGVWVVGTLYYHSFKNPLSTVRSTGLLFFFGGLQMLGLGLLLGEGAQVDLADIGPAAWMGFAALVLGASLGGFTSYFWLLRHSTPAIAISYEYVVPVIGLLLGWRLAGEPLNMPVLVACALTVLGALFIMRPARPAAPGGVEPRIP